MLKYQKSKTKALSMGQKDTISKNVLKNIARDISKHILHIDIKEDMEIINTDFEKIESRESDLLFKNGDEIVHIEIQNDNHPQMHLRMGRYYMEILFLFEKYRVSQYMIYIGKKKCYMKSKIKRDKIEYSYDIIDMRDIACEELLNSNDSSAIALSILCDFKGRDKQSVINTILRRLRELNNDRDFEKYLEIVTLYSTNRGLEKEIDEGVKMLTFDIEKTPFYQIGMQTGAKNAKRETTFENAIIMIKDFQIAIDDVVKKLNIRKEELLEYMKNKN